MSGKDWLKLAVLILVPLSAWLFVLYRFKQEQKAVIYPSFVRYESDTQVRINYFREKWNIKEGQRIIYPFPMRGFVAQLGKPPPVGRGHPVLFLNIGWIVFPEVWDLAIREALQVPSLHLVLLCSAGPSPEHWEWRTKQLREMLKRFPSERVSALIGEQMDYAFGLELGGILCVLCDGAGVVRVIEVYPSLKRNPRWGDEVTDWRPKLHQAVKKVLDEFFPKQSR